MVLAIDHWRMYLRNTEFKVVTDCKSLLSTSDTLFSKSDPALIRKCQELANYKFVVEHVEGKSNTLCDFLSRFPFRRKHVEVGCQTNEECSKNGRFNISEEQPKKRLDKVRKILVRSHRLQVHEPTDSSEESDVGSDMKAELEAEETERHEKLIEDYIGDSSQTTNLKENNVKIENRDDRDSEEQATDLQLLFEAGHDGKVTFNSEKKSNEERICLCNVPEMQSRKTIKHGEETATLAATESVEVVKELPDLDYLRREQGKDAILVVVRKWIESGNKGLIQVNRTPERLLSYWKQFNLLVVEDGLIKRRWIKKNSEEERYLTVIPEECEEEIMRLFHEKILCHHGAGACVARCREFFYWPKMEAEFSLFIKACVKCGEIKPPRAYLKAPLKHIMFHAFNDAIILVVTNGRFWRIKRF